jgi:dipicolinate synthase subunit B
MAIKSHIRNNGAVLIALSTNDALSANFKNLGKLFNTKNYYFVPMFQDDHMGKPSSLTSDYKLLPVALKYALEGKQIQPLFLNHA